MSQLNTLFSNSPIHVSLDFRVPKKPIGNIEKNTVTEVVSVGEGDDHMEV